MVAKKPETTVSTIRQTSCMQLRGDAVPSWMRTASSYLVGKTQLETENDMNVAELIQALSEMPQDMPVHFWANGERQTIIEVRDVGDCVDLYEEETLCSNIKVYFEAKTGAHKVATFDTEETYIACFPALEQLAMLKGYIVTESKEAS